MTTALRPGDLVISKEYMSLWTKPSGQKTRGDVIRLTSVDRIVGMVISTRRYTTEIAIIAGNRIYWSWAYEWTLA